MTALSRYLLMLGTAMEYKKAALGEETKDVLDIKEVLLEIFTISRPMKAILTPLKRFVLIIAILMAILNMFEYVGCLSGSTKLMKSYLTETY